MIATKNLLLVSTGSNTYAVDLASHTQAWAYPAGGQLALSAQGILFIAQSSGRLTAVSVR
jgi:outer membrane protein assembly factor BamB